MSSLKPGQALVRTFPQLTGFLAPEITRGVFEARPFVQWGQKLTWTRSLSHPQWVGPLGPWAGRVWISWHGSGPWLTACSLPGQYFCCRPCQVEIRYLQCFDRSPRRLDEKGCLWD